MKSIEIKLSPEQEKHFLGYIRQAEKDYRDGGAENRGLVLLQVSRLNSLKLQARGYYLPAAFANKVHAVCTEFYNDHMQTP